MTAAEQLGTQIRAARLAAGLSLRRLGALASVPPTTLEGYEAGASVPAEKLARIADALSHHTFKIDGYQFSVTRVSVESKVRPHDQLSLDFAGEYNYARAVVKINPSKITIFLDGTKSLHATARR